MNEFIALGHGLRRASLEPSGEGSPDNRSCRERMLTAIHGRSGAQVALLQSPILRDRDATILQEIEEHKNAKSVTHVPGRKCYPCIGTFNCAVNRGCRFAHSCPVSFH